MEFRSEFLELDGPEVGGAGRHPGVARRGLKPTLGLVPGFGIAPIDVSRDTAGPMEKTVEDAAITLQSLAEIPGGINGAPATRSCPAHTASTP